MQVDYCTGFFENWIRWKKPSWKGFVLASLHVSEVFPLSELCKVHDERCSTHTFFNLLKENRVVGGFWIGAVATIGCFFKNPKNMWKRL